MSSGEVFLSDLDRERADHGGVIYAVHRQRGRGTRAVNGVVFLLPTLRAIGSSSRVRIAPGVAEMLHADIGENLSPNMPSLKRNFFVPPWLIQVRTMVMPRRACR